MRCSLLTLSTYLDNELAPDRAGEVEAHLVACQRCSSGLGYLREEKEHIHALAAVHSDPGAAEDLLGTVGLQYLPGTAVDPHAPAPQFLLDLAESPAPSAVPPPPDESGKYLELNGSPSPKAAPELPEEENAAAESPVAAHADVAPATDAEPAEAPLMEAFDTHDDEDADLPRNDADEAREDERVEEAAASAAPAPPAPSQWSRPYTPGPSRATPQEPAASATPPVHETPEPELVVPKFLVGDAVDATEHDMIRPEPPLQKPATPIRSAPGVALTGRASLLFGRARDAVSVRWALMRGSSTEDIDEDDDAIQIVSGNGAPERRGARMNHGARDTFAPQASAAPGTSPPLAPKDDDKPDISFAPPEHEPLQRPAFTANERLKAQAALRKLEDEGVLTRDDEPSQGGRMPTSPAEPVQETPVRSLHFDMQDPVAPPAEFPRPQPHEEEPAQPGRHQRALHRDGPRFRVPAFTPSRPKRSASPPQFSVDGLLQGRMVWVFAASVLVLGLVGLLIGKTVTPASHHLAPGAVPNPTAIALPSSHAQATPTPVATPQPTPQPTATPAPTPAAPNPNQLTGAQNLGDGGTGFTVNGIRYGAHPGDYRIVFDLTGNGSPSTTVGFGSPTTMYVIFSGTTGPATVAQPAAGNTATAVKLMPPSTIPGKTVYEFTLSGPAKLSTMYLQSPLRLVIDLS